MNQGDATPTAQQHAYMMTILELMRARIKDLRGSASNGSSLHFLGRSFSLLQELHQRWDTLPEPKGVPHPCDVWSWL